jgi:VanZ family protein
LYFSRNKATLFWALLIAVLSLFPGDQFPKVGVSGLDLIIHFFFYSIFNLLLIVGNIQQEKFIFLRNRPVSWAFLISISYGLIIELLQGTVFVSRGAELSDAVANSMGSVVGWVLFLIIYGSPKNYMPWNKKKTQEKILEKDQLNSSL